MLGYQLTVLAHKMAGELSGPTNEPFNFADTILPIHCLPNVRSQEQDAKGAHCGLNARGSMLPEHFCAFRDFASRVLDRAFRMEHRLCWFAALHRCSRAPCSYLRLLKPRLGG